MGAETLMVMKPKGKCRILEINRSRDNEYKQNITDAGYQTETGADKLMIMKHKQAIV